MELFSDEWRSAAQRILDQHQYTTVPEFAVTLRVHLSDLKASSDLVYERRRLQILPAGDRAADAEATMPAELFNEALLDGKPSRLADEFDAGSVSLTGDFGKLRFFANGVLQGTDPDGTKALLELAG